MGSHTNTRSVTEGSFSDAFSTLNILRSYNNLLAPNSDVRRYELTYPRSDYASREPEPARTTNSAMLTAPLSPLAPTAPFSLGTLLQPPLLAAIPPLVPPVGISHSFTNATAAAAMSRNIIENAVLSSMHQSRRPRSEKKPIPNDMKDEKYYERRKRNNEAAKKSRDARKIREDHIALRATILEHENAMLRAQVVTLREECQSLRQMLIKQRMPPMQSVDQLIDRPISSSVTLTPASSAASLPCQV